MTVVGAPAPATAAPAAAAGPTRGRSVRRLGLRARITLAFVLGALLLSGLLSATTMSLTRNNLLEEREQAAAQRVGTNAATLRTNLENPDFDPATQLPSLPTTGSPVVVVSRPQPTSYSLNPELGADAVPEALRDEVEGRSQAAQMRYERDGATLLAVGVPIPEASAAYYEVLPLTELENSLDTLAVSLLGAGALTTTAGATLGWWASRRTLRPLVTVSSAAEAIAAGRLDTRLETHGDADLAPLVGSFNSMVAALGERIERDARFASDVSHELRSPLMTLSASAAVLENQRDQLPERARTAVDLLTSDIDRFNQLVEDLLEISRFDAGAATLDLDEVDITELVVQAVSSMSGSPVPVRYDPVLAGTLLRCDKRRVVRVLANLLDNAAKYADGAEVVSVERAPHAVRIAVCDRGPGIPASERERIFDRFSRGTTGGSRGADTGTGLGLALVKEHVALQGGRVWVEDRPDGEPGSRFVVELPTGEPHEEPPPSTPGELP